MMHVRLSSKASTASLLGCTCMLRSNELQAPKGLTFSVPNTSDARLSGVTTFDLLEAPLALTGSLAGGKLPGAGMSASIRLGLGRPGPLSTSKFCSAERASMGSVAAIESC